MKKARIINPVMYDDGSESDIRESLNKLRLLSSMAFKANDIQACSIEIDPDKDDYKDAKIDLLYHGNSEVNKEILISWEHYISVIHPDSQLVFEDEFRKVAKGEVAESKFELYVKFPVHERFQWRDYTISVYKKDERGRPTIIFSCSSDVHRRKTQEMTLEEAMEKAQQADRMKSKYLADMSHEIRTPLNAITGFAELMAFTESEEERMSYYEIVKTNNLLLMQLINDILDLSKIEADAIKVAYEVVDVNDLMDSTFASARLRMQRGVELVLDKGLTECQFGTDPIRLMQLVNNLLNNAIKNTKEGSITFGYSSLPDNQLHFYVRDTGIGIAKDRLENLFGRFVKLNDYVDGIGLGLAICRGLVTKMGGSIHVESELGVGSEFSFILPSHDVEE